MAASGRRGRSRSSRPRRCHAACAATRARRTPPAAWPPSPCPPSPPRSARPRRWRSRPRPAGKVPVCHRQPPCCRSERKLIKTWVSFLKETLRGYPVGGEDDEPVLAADPPLRHLRRRDDAVVLDAVVAKRARHGQSPRLPVRQPHAVHARLVGEAAHAAVAPPDALLLCNKPGSTQTISLIDRGHASQLANSHGNNDALRGRLGLKSTVSWTAATAPSSAVVARTARESPTLPKTMRSPCLTTDSAVLPLCTASRRRLRQSSSSTAAQAAAYDCRHRSNHRQSPSFFSPSTSNASVTASCQWPSSDGGRDSRTALAT
jgi:hypothetical protein